MARFSTYLISLEEGTVEGTNDVELIESYINNDAYLILLPNSGDGAYFLGSRKENEIPELLSDTPSSATDEDDDPTDSAL